MSLVRLDYDRLCDDYEAGLIDNLRGFSVDEGAKGGSLALWVPDADLSRSVRNLVEAVILDGASEVEIAFDPALAADGSGEALRSAVGHLGSATADLRAGRLVLRLTGLAEHDTGAVSADLAARASRRAEQDARARQRRAPAGDDRGFHEVGAPLAAVAALYATAVAAVDLTALRHEGSAGSTAGDDVPVIGRVAGVELLLAVDPADHTIRRARFSGARSDAERAVLERFCMLLEGLPVLEASDHGVIRLEYALRGGAPARPVQGIVTPFSADRAFTLPNALIRAALSQYREARGYAEIRNFYDVEPAAEWLALDDAQRRERLSAVFDATAAQLGLSHGIVSIQEIDYDVRVTVEFAGDLQGADKQQILMTLERSIKDQVDQRLELFQGELKDSNTIRRLS